MSSTFGKYKVLGTVGEGAHGIVMKAIHSVTGEILALKKVTLKKITDEGLPVQVIREIKALQYLQQHENVVFLKDMFPQGLSVVLVFEYIPSNLWEILDSYKLNGSQIKRYMIMLLKGMEFIHVNNIIHRDIKPANLLIAETGCLKIGDFGLCRLHFSGERRAYSHQVATRWYRSPELLYGARYYDEGLDLWSVGCIFAEMLIGTPIFPGENDIDQLYKVISSLGSPTSENWPGHSELPDYNKISFSKMDPIPLLELVSTDIPLAVNFLGKFLLYDSSKRIRASKALDDDFFKNEPVACPMTALPPIPAKKPNKSESEVLNDF